MDTYFQFLIEQHHRVVDSACLIITVGYQEIFEFLFSEIILYNYI